MTLLSCGDNGQMLSIQQHLIQPVLIMGLISEHSFMVAGGKVPLLFCVKALWDQVMGKKR